jgi:hypothetical protein
LGFVLLKIVTYEDTCVVKIVTDVLEKRQKNANTRNMDDDYYFGHKFRLLLLKHQIVLQIVLIVNFLKFNLKL